MQNLQGYNLTMKQFVSSKILGENNYLPCKCKKQNKTTGGKVEHTCHIFAIVLYLTRQGN